MPNIVAAGMLGMGGAHPKLRGGVVGFGACRGRLGEVMLLIIRRSAWFLRVMPTRMS